MTKAKKRGQKGRYVIYGGRPVCAVVEGRETGLSQDKNGIFYYMYTDDNGKRRKKTCTKDLRIAYNRFIEFVEGRREEEFLQVERKHLRHKVDTFIDNSKPNLIAKRDELGKLTITRGGRYSHFDHGYTVSDQEFFAWLESYKGKEEELKRKSGIAVKFLNGPDRATHIKLSTLLEYFKKHISFKLEQTKTNYVQWCKHFFDYTGVTYINDITEDMIRKYESDYLDPTRKAGDPENPNNGSYSYKWKNDRAGAIKKVLSFYSEKHPTSSKKVKEVREWLMLWDRTKDNKPLDFQELSKEDFKKLYNASDKRWKAILLMSLNTMSGAKSLSDMEFKNINLEKHYLRMLREKRRTIKVGYLWDETVKAIKEYLADRKGRSKWLFTSNRGSQYQKRSLENYLKKLCFSINNNDDEDKHLSLDNITFGLFRKGASTAADNGKNEIHYIEYCLGHEVTAAGKSLANYVARKPERVKPIADAIYQEYEIDLLSK